MRVEYCEVVMVKPLKARTPGFYQPGVLIFLAMRNEIPALKFIQSMP
jgi:hypothetical protein